ncbi:MAG TPA: aldolase/citrate lyase family protein, partial [Opitutaceae bacterium]
SRHRPCRRTLSGPDHAHTRLEPAGIMVPHISTPAKTETCVQAIHYPPRGRQGVSRSVRAYAYGLRPMTSADQEQDPVLMVQIETVRAVDQAANIARVAGVDVLFVGPGDLNYDIKVNDGVSDCSYESCLTTVLAAADAAGKHAGILVRDVREVPPLVEMGFSLIALDSDLAILRSGYQRNLEQLRKVEGARTTRVVGK